MQNSKVKELMSSLEKAQVDEAVEALMEARQPAVRITTSKRMDLSGKIDIRGRGSLENSEWHLD